MGIRVVVGVATGESVDVERSVGALRGSTPPGTEIVRLDATGGAAFDELITHAADTLILIESGAVVAPRCIDLLVAALQRTGAGLAGPSTNLAWNEQSAVASVGREPRALGRDAGVLLRRFGYAVRGLDPPTLGDFCLAVRHDVVAAIGGADPAFGQGPRWELDYGARAAAAGYAGIWVCGAYAWRPSGRGLTTVPPTLTAPARPSRSSVPPRRPSDASIAVPTGALSQATPAPGDSVPVAAPTRPSVTVPAPSALPRAPLVSCIMPTRGRPRFARQAARYFLAQDYPNRELVVVEDGPPQLAAMLPADPRIRLVPAAPPTRLRPSGPWAAQGASIGALRNLGVAAAAGDIIVLWDDDDWHGPTRITDQVAPILTGAADVTGLAGVPWFEPAGWRCWQVSPPTEQTLLRCGVYGGTITFRRALWQHAPFPDRSLAEDAEFLDRAVRGGARLQRVDGRGRYVYVRHEGNSWQLRPAGRPGWTAISPSALPGLSPADLGFYASQRNPAGPSSTLVSCIMPTRNRRAYVPLAIDYFTRQTHRNAELVIIDDGTEPVADLVPAHDSIRYERLERPLILGAKRNLACELAAGELIAHWDDDDWQASDRLEVQVAALDGADLCGASNLLFWDPASSRAWRYRWPRGNRPWAAGTSLCYPRELWRRRAFSDVAVGEDTRFVWQAEIRRLADVSQAGCVVALVHPGNTVHKTGRGSYWATVDVGEVADRLGPDMARYPAASLPPARRDPPASPSSVRETPADPLIAAAVG
jgi:glycosyltransferase involved in cell wall biosynthesis